mgnify:CR=1 FL=1
MECCDKGLQSETSVLNFFSLRCTSYQFIKLLYCHFNCFIAIPPLLPNTNLVKSTKKSSLYKFSKLLKSEAFLVFLNTCQNCLNLSNTLQQMSMNVRKDWMSVRRMQIVLTPKDHSVANVRKDTFLLETAQTVQVSSFFRYVLFLLNLN